MVQAADERMTMRASVAVLAVSCDIGSPRLTAGRSRWREGRGRRRQRREEGSSIFGSKSSDIRKWPRLLVANIDSYPCLEGSHWGGAMIPYHRNGALARLDAGVLPRGWSHRVQDEVVQRQPQLEKVGDERLDGGEVGDVDLQQDRLAGGLAAAPRNE